MTNFASELTLEILLFLIASFAVTLFAFITYMAIAQNRRNAKIQEKLVDFVVHSKFSDKRSDLEDSILALGNELQETSEEFGDANRLPLRGQKINEAHDNKFLSSLGIDQSKIEKDTDKIFVLTPFARSELETFATIRSSLSSAGLKVLRGDEDKRTDLLPFIVRSMLEAQLVIANINGRNPNVMYELGIAHMLDIEVMIVARLRNGRVSSIPIDLRAKNILVYAELTELEKRLPIAVLQYLRPTE